MMLPSGSRTSIERLPQGMSARRHHDVHAGVPQALDDRMNIVDLEFDDDRPVGRGNRGARVEPPDDALVEDGQRRPFSRISAKTGAGRKASDR